MPRLRLIKLSSGDVYTNRHACPGQSDAARAYALICGLLSAFGPGGRSAAAAAADGRPWLADAGGGTDAEAPTNGRQSPSVPRRTDHITRLSSHGGVARGGGKRALPSTRPRAGPAVVSAVARVSQGERCRAASSNIRLAAPFSGGEILRCRGSARRTLRRRRRCHGRTSRLLLLLHAATAAARAQNVD